MTFVGKNDPAGDDGTTGPIVRLVQERCIDRVVMFPTERGVGPDDTQDNAELTREVLIDRGLLGSDCIDIRPLALKNADDWAEIQNKARAEIVGFWERRRDVIDRLFLNVTSGTQQMTSSLLVWAHGGWLGSPTLLQARDPTKVEEGELVREVSVSFLEEDNIVNRCRNYLKQGSFSSARMEMNRLTEIASTFRRKKCAELLADLFDGYRRWDLLDYGRAKDKVKKVHEECCSKSDLQELAEVVNPQWKLLMRLKRESARGVECPVNLLDLYHNARRRFFQDAYVDVLARCWRLYEGILYFLLRSRYGVSPRKINDSINKQNLSRCRRYLRQHSQRIGKDLNRWQTRKVLQEEFHDSVMMQMNKIMINDGHSELPNRTISESLEALRPKRNQSVAAHGMRVVTERVAKESLVVTGKLLELVVPPRDRDLLEDYQFDLKSLPGILSILSL